ncbi:MAG: hypothetical protein JXB10_17845 [Pirellulales bacterium]|nr:hypothetical protein [Pirellulales bacterium]
MKHLEITQQPDIVRNFVLSLSATSEDLILENQGVPFARITPIDPSETDQNLLEQSILNRREESRQNNADWEHLDLECWEKL